MASIARRPDGTYRPRSRDATGEEHARHFERKADAQRWLDEQTAALVNGTWADPKTAKVPVEEWCDTWLAGYGTRRARTVRQAEVHLAQIRAHFGGRRLAAVRPSDVRSWTAELKNDGLEPS